MAWVHCGYESKTDLNSDSSSTEVINYSRNDTNRMIEKVMGADAVVGLKDLEIEDSMDQSEFESYGDADDDDYAYLNAA